MVFRESIIGPPNTCIPVLMWSGLVPYPTSHHTNLLSPQFPILVVFHLAVSDKQRMSISRGHKNQKVQKILNVSGIPDASLRGMFDMPAKGKGYLHIIMAAYKSKLEADINTRTSSFKVTWLLMKRNTKLTLLLIYRNTKVTWLLMYKNTKVTLLLLSNLWKWVLPNILC